MCVLSAHISLQMRNQAKLHPPGTASVSNQTRGLCHGFYWLLTGRVVLKIYNERGTVSLSGGSKGPVSPCEVYNVFYLGRWKKGAFVRRYGDVQREVETRQEVFKGQFPQILSLFISLWFGSGFWDF